MQGPRREVSAVASCDYFTNSPYTMLVIGSGLSTGSVAAMAVLQPLLLPLVVTWKGSLDSRISRVPRPRTAILLLLLLALCPPSAPR